MGSESWTPTRYGPTQNYTVEAWVYPDQASYLATQTSNANGPYSGYRILCGARNEGGNGGFGMSIGTNVVEIVYVGTSRCCSPCVYAITLSGWTHVAFSVASLYADLFINGVYIKRGYYMSLNSYLPYAYLLYHPYGSYSGLADEIRMWNYSRSGTEIARDMCQRLDGSQKGLLSLIRFYDDIQAPFDAVTQQYVNMYQTSRVLGSAQDRFAAPCPYLESIG